MATPEKHIVDTESGNDGDYAHKEKVDKAGDSSVDQNAQPVRWTFARVVAVISLCLVYVGAQEILYFTGGALTYIGVSINTNVPNWLLTANTLAVCAIVPFVGSITDLLGRKWVAVFGSLLLVISSVVMGVTQSLGSAVTAQALGGVGAGICELTALAGIAEITPVKWRGVTISLVTFSIVPFMPYLIYIQLVREASSWRWIFMISGIWNFVGLIGIVLCYRPPPRHNVDGLSRRQILKQIDYMGAFLSISGITLFLVGLQAGGYQFPWTDGRVLGPLISGIILILAFVAWEIWGATTPMVPAEIFQGQRVVTLGLIIVFVAGMNFYSILGFFPLYLEVVYPATPIEIGVRALGYPIAILAGACIVSTAMSYSRGHVREMFFIAATIMTAFGGALAATTISNPAYAIAIATIDAFGIGAIVVPALTLVLYACPDRYIGTTAALSLCTRFLGGSVGTTIYFNVFNTQITAKLPTYVAGAAIAAGLPPASAMAFVQALAGPGGAQAAAQVSGANTAIVQAGAMGLVSAYNDSLKYVWYTTIPFGIICMGCCAMLPNIRRFMSNRVAVDIH